MKDNPLADNSPMMAELCPQCGDEVEILAVMEVQTCPSCGRPILPCALCDMDTTDCNECKLQTEKIKYETGINHRPDRTADRAWS